jgi:archaellum component FlaC
VAANNGRRGATVLTKEELKFQIATEQAFIKRQRAAQDRMRTQNSGVRSSSISADLAAFDLTIFNAKDRIAEHEKKIEELENEN